MSKLARQLDRVMLNSPEFMKYLDREYDRVFGAKTDLFPLMETNKMAKILCLDFDGVLHSYSSGWQGAQVVANPPNPGAMDFLLLAIEHFHVAIYSSRSNYEGGIEIMQSWLMKHDPSMGRISEAMHRGQAASANKGIGEIGEISFPTVKPPAFLTIDDRAMMFTGEWPSITEINQFKPWYQKGG